MFFRILEVILLVTFQGTMLNRFLVFLNNCWMVWVSFWALLESLFKVMFVRSYAGMGRGLQEWERVYRNGGVTP